MCWPFPLGYNHLFPLTQKIREGVASRTQSCADHDIIPLNADKLGYGL